MENLLSGIGEFRASGDGPCSLSVCFPAIIYLVHSQAVCCEVSPHSCLQVGAGSWTGFLSVFLHLFYVTTP